VEKGSLLNPPKGSSPQNPEFLTKGEDAKEKWTAKEQGVLGSGILKGKTKDGGAGGEEVSVREGTLSRTISRGPGGKKSPKKFVDRLLKLKGDQELGKRGDEQEKHRDRRKKSGGGVPKQKVKTGLKTFLGGRVVRNFSESQRMYEKKKKAVVEESAPERRIKSYTGEGRAPGERRLDYNPSGGFSGGHR